MNLISPLLYIILLSCTPQSQHLNDENGSKPELTNSPDSLSNELNHFINRKIEEIGFNGVISITMNGKTLLSSGYGWADQEHSRALRTDMPFRIGSMSKQFTAMAIMILVERGKLKLSDPLSLFFDNFPKWKTITIHQLLTHSSGIMHSWELPDFINIKDETILETINRFKNKDLLFQPGKGFHYSGVGYFILAHLIEKFSGLSYSDFIKNEIFEPLKMTESGVNMTADYTDEQVHGYYLIENEDPKNRWTLKEAIPVHLTILTGGGNIYSSANDLQKWNHALQEKLLISNDLYQKMYTPEFNNYGYGWFIKEKFGLQSIEHSGGVPGFDSNILRVTEKGICIIVLRNMPPVNLNKSNSIIGISDDLLQIILKY